MPARRRLCCSLLAQLTHADDSGQGTSLSSLADRRTGLILRSNNVCSSAPPNQITKNRTASIPTSVLRQSIPSSHPGRCWRTPPGLCPTVHAVPLLSTGTPGASHGARPTPLRFLYDRFYPAPGRLSRKTRLNCQNKCKLHAHFDPIK